MAIPSSLLALFKSKRFWADYLFLTDTPYPSSYKKAFKEAEDDESDDLDDGESWESNEQDSSGGGDGKGADTKEAEKQGSGNGDSDNGKSSEDNDSDDDNSDKSSDDSYGVPSIPLTFPFHRARSTQRRASASGSGPESDSDSDSDPDLYTFNLAITLDANLSYIPLTFTTPDAGEVDIAHDDQAHWQPHVLRWEELKAICKAVAATAEREGGDKDGGYAHPGIPLLLMYRFAPICERDDIERIVGLLARAWRRVLGEDVRDGDVRRFIERADYRDQKFRWFVNNEGNWWIGKGEDAETAHGVYTYRGKEAVKEGGQWLNAEWNGLVDEAKAAAEGWNDDGSAPDDVMTRFAPRKKHSLNVWLALVEKDRPMHQRAGRYFQLTVDGILRILDIGKAGPSGAASTVINGRSVYTSDHSSIMVWGDLARGRTIIKQTLWWLGAPLATTLRDGGTYDELPFDLADEAEDSSKEVYLGFCVPDILPSCSWLVSHTLPDSLRATLESEEVLTDTGTVSGPTKEGWLTVTTTDWGELGFNFSRFDEEELEGTGDVALRQVTPQASDTLYRLMLASGGVLAPVALTAEPLRDELAERWVPHRVVDAETLHGILSGGAFERWVKTERKAGVSEHNTEEGVSTDSE